MAPFPTGPLAVFSRDLAANLFETCPYSREYERRARLWGRRTHCKGPRKHLSFASVLCDTVVSHWLAMCAAKNVTVVHTTRTKSHHYMWRGAGLGWMAPSNISLAIHYLKVKPELKSGPNLTIGGEWSHVHAVVGSARSVAFPSLMYSMQARWGHTYYGLNESRRQYLLQSINPVVFHWYTQECSFEAVELRRAAATRAAAYTALIRGPRPAGWSDAKFLGGHPPGWPYSGCNPSRFRPYPRWPPPPEVLEAIANTTEHTLSSRFIYFNHGPSAAQLALPLARVIEAVRSEGGLEVINAHRFGAILRRKLAPLPWTGGSDVYNAVKEQYRTQPVAKAAWSRGGISSHAHGATRPPAALVHSLPSMLYEHVHAKVSLAAYAYNVSVMLSGLRAEHATRDNSYYWFWT